MNENRLIPLLDGVKFELRMFVNPLEEPVTPARPGAQPSRLADRTIQKDPITNNFPYKSKDVFLARIDKLSQFNTNAR